MTGITYPPIMPYIMVRGGKAAVAFYQRAFGAGAEVVRPLTDEFYGRNGKLRDPFGHLWSVNGPVKGAGG